jgi:DNA-binding MarR family transcriptional regulator
VDTLQSNRPVAPARGQRRRGLRDGWRPTSGDVVDRLLRTANEISSEQARRLRPVSLSPSAFTVLRQLADAPDGRLQPCALASRLSVSRPSMCGLIDGLQAKGLVARKPHSQDGRRVLVELSAAGRRLLDEQRAGYDALLDTLLDDLSDSDRRRLIGLLERVGPQRD